MWLVISFSLLAELQFMLGCMWKQLVISVSLLFRLWQDLSTRTHLGMTAYQRREEICDGGCTATSGWSCPSVCHNSFTRNSS